MHLLNLSLCATERHSKNYLKLEVLNFNPFACLVNNKNSSPQFIQVTVTKAHLLQGKNVFVGKLNKNVHCMVYPPSHCHSDSGKHKEYTKHHAKPVLTQ